MDLKERIQAFSLLGKWLETDFYNDCKRDIIYASEVNPWFDIENIKKAVYALASNLTADNLTQWVSEYDKIEYPKNKDVLIIMAGNIPLVGFHDFLCVLVSGCRVIIKMSSDDNILLKLIIKYLIKINLKFRDLISIVENLKGVSFHALIATGNDNTADYFNFYFKDVKKIIRSNRTSIAILDGSESEEELSLISNDIFSYFGLGCRSVSKLFLPKNFDLNRLFKSFYTHKSIINNFKYSNNFDYYKTVNLLNKKKILENGFIILKEEESLFSPLSVLHYEFYDCKRELNVKLKKYESNIQCVVCRLNKNFGKSQFPSLSDYADGVNTLYFLQNI